MPSRRSMTISCTLWCISCSLELISISKRFLPPEPAPPRATISTARASGSVSTQSHQRSPSSRNTATISALGSEPFSLVGSPAKNPRRSKPSLEVSFAPRECENRTASSKPCEEGFRARNGYPAPGDNRIELRGCPRRLLSCSCGQHAYCPRAASVCIDSLLSYPKKKSSGFDSLKRGSGAHGRNGRDPAVDQEV